MEIRPYNPADRHACLAVLTATTPSLADSFAAYLDSNPALYIAEHDDAVVGFGGIDFSAQNPQLIWARVQPALQRKGIGRFLLMYRMREISRRGNFEFVTAEVPDDTKSFYAAQGFRESAPGVMTKRLSVCP